MIIDAIAGPFYNIIKVMMKGPNKRSNIKLIAPFLYLIGNNSFVIVQTKTKKSIFD